MSNKTFTFAGVSRLNGVIKARFANDQMRVKVLLNGGHKDVDITELIRPMTKAEAVESLLKANFHNSNTEIQAALEAELDKRAPKAASKDKPKKEAKKPKKEVPAKKAISLDAIKAKAAPKPTLTKAQVEAQLAATEDAPF
jgi:murein L,D-transpeptidase YafK